MKTLADLRVGDTVILKGYYQDEEAKVARIARKYFYVDLFGRELGFDRQTGRAADPDSRWMVALTFDMRHAEVRISRARAALSEASVQVHYLAADKVLPVYEALAPVLGLSPLAEAGSDGR